LDYTENVNITRYAISCYNIEDPKLHSSQKLYNLQSPPTNQHPTFYRPDALPVTQPTVSKALKEKFSLTFSLSVLMAIFPGEPGLAGFIEAKDDGSGGGN